uniref:Uncharacterized protein n=1 Tax=Anguilla anguilla TaxID=7936 RepID=A0A0E9S5C5_ANGAN
MHHYINAQAPCTTPLIRKATVQAALELPVGLFFFCFRPQITQY